MLVVAITVTARHYRSLYLMMLVLIHFTTYLIISLAIEFPSTMAIANHRPEYMSISTPMMVAMARVMHLEVTGFSPAARRALFAAR